MFNARASSVDNLITEEMVTCPVTQQIFHTPVLLHGSGITVEEEIAKKLNICPVTRKPVTGYDINYAVKENVAKFLKTYPERKNDQYTPKQENRAEEKKNALAQEARQRNEGLDYYQMDWLDQEPMRHLGFFSILGQQPLPQVALEIKENEIRENAIEEHKETLPIRLPAAAAIAGGKEICTLDSGELFVKVLLLGDAEAGKSAFLQASVKNENNTVAVDFKMIKDNGINYQIWNTAGQDRFKTISSSYYRNVNIILFFGDDPRDVKRWMLQVMADAPLSRLGFVNLKYVRDAVTGLLNPSIDSDVSYLDRVLQRNMTTINAEAVPEIARKLLLHITDRIVTIQEVAVVAPAPSSKKGRCSIM